MQDTRTNQQHGTRDHVCKTIQGKIEHGRGRVLRIRLCVREIVARLLTRAGESVPCPHTQPSLAHIPCLVESGESSSSGWIKGGTTIKGGTIMTAMR